MTTETVSPVTANNASRTRGLKPFKPGQSGNPNGRPKKSQDVIELARDNSLKALQKLVKLIDSEDDKVALLQNII